MRTKDTKLMNAILEYIDSTYQDTCRAPSYKEIADALNISKATVSNYINELEARGLLINYEGSRGIRTMTMEKNDKSTLSIGVVGTIACGVPLLAEENIETYISFPKAFLGSGKYFILRAKGNSMINAGIDDGDMVIVRQQENAEQGQIIVALIDNEATLKRFYLDKRKRKVRLHPENDEMEDMYYDYVEIQGIAVKVIKSLV